MPTTVLFRPIAEFFLAFQPPRLYWQLENTAEGTGWVNPTIYDGWRLIAGGKGFVLVYDAFQHLS